MRTRFDPFGPTNQPAKLKIFSWNRILLVADILPFYSAESRPEQLGQVD
jgi:hypothetical protein